AGGGVARSSGADPARAGGMDRAARRRERRVAPRAAARGGVPVPDLTAFSLVPRLAAGARLPCAVVARALSRLGERSALPSATVRVDGRDRLWRLRRPGGDRLVSWGSDGAAGEARMPRPPTRTPSLPRPHSTPSRRPA